MKKLTKKSSITFVELPPTQFGTLNGPLGYDIYSQSKSPSRAIPTLRGVLVEEGYTNTREINPYYHGEKGKLTHKNMKDIFESDALLISSITRTSPQSMKLAEIYKLNNPAGIVIAGGPDPTFRTAEWLKYVDLVVRGEGEKTLKELMQRLIGDPSQLNDIHGLAYTLNKDFQINAPRNLLTEKELGELPHPFYDPDVIRHLLTGTIETTRGCPYNCDFCSVTEMYGNRYRRRPLKWTLEEMLRISKYGKYTFIVDDNLATGGPKDIERLEAIAKIDGKRKNKTAQITVHAAKNDELLEAMRKAGIESLCIGVESISNETLKGLGKLTTAELNKYAVPKFRKAGFFVHGMMMLGGDGDTIESLRETEEWANENLDSVQYFAPVPIPGTKFRQQMKEEGRIFTEDWFLYDAQSVLIRPKNISPYDLQMKITKMYESFYSYKNTLKRLKKSQHKKMSIAITLWAKNFGLKNVLFDPQSKAHLEFLKSIS